jgi:hypothetical protein
MAKSYNLAKVTTATTGTGTITLGTPSQGYLSFADAGVQDGETVSYGIRDLNHSETGTGVYTSSGATLTRNVTTSTNSDSAINLSGSAEVYITARAEDFREKLAANRTYYVRTDGSDSNTGLANTAGGAWLTLQHAYDTVVASLDFGSYTVTIQVEDGTYTGALAITSDWVGGGSLRIVGDETTPANTVLSVTSADVISTSVPLSSGTLYIGGFTVKTTTSGSGIMFYYSADVTLGRMAFDDIAGGVCVLTPPEATLYLSANIDIIGGPYSYFIDVGYNSNLYVGGNFTLTGTPDFTTAFVITYDCAVANWFGTFTGAATGKRFSVYHNGVINTGGSGLTYFPGDEAGTLATGGVYDGITSNREKLTANRTYYVRTDGDDANTGLVNSAGGAWLTWQYAIDYVCENLDFAGYTVTLKQGASGTFTTGTTGSGIKNWTGGGSLNIYGDEATPGNCIISVTSGNCFRTYGILGGDLTIAGFDLRTTTSGDCIYHTATGTLWLGNNIYGACAGTHIHIYSIGAYCEVYDDYTINGNATTSHIRTNGLCYIYNGSTVTVTGALAIGTFAYCAAGSEIEDSATYNIGTSVTGTRFAVETGGIIVGSSSLTHFPGDAAGTIASGGQYDVYNEFSLPIAYGSLPGSPVEGMMRSITDSNTATWGATAAAGGANKVGVRYNGTNWTVFAA